MFRTILFKLTLAIWFIAWFPFILLSLVTKKICRKTVLACASGVIGIARIFGIKYQIHYPSNELHGAPKDKNMSARLDGKVIIAAKHMSTLEVAILSTKIPNSFFIVKKELTMIPVYGWAFKRMGLLPVNRTSGKTNMDNLVKQVEEKVKDNMTLIIYPEGTRTKPGERRRLKRGLLFIAEELKLPILPVGTDAGLYWPKKGKIKPGTVNMYFEEILPPTATLEEISEAINRNSA